MSGYCDVIAAKDVHRSSSQAARKRIPHRAEVRTHTSSVVLTSKRIAPLVGSIIVSSMRAVVVLPEAFSPTIATVSP